MWHSFVSKISSNDKIELVHYHVIINYITVLNIIHALQSSTDFDYKLNITKNKNMLQVKMHFFAWNMWKGHIVKLTHDNIFSKWGFKCHL